MGKKSNSRLDAAGKMVMYYVIIAFIVAACSINVENLLLSTGLSPAQADSLYNELLFSLSMSLILLFSKQKSALSLRVSIICAVGWLIVGPWQWTLIPAALAHIIVSDLIEKKSKQWWHYLLISWALYFGYHTLPPSLVTHPLLYGIGFAIVILTAFLYNQKKSAITTNKDKINSEIKTTVAAIKHEHRADKPAINNYQRPMQELYLLSNQVLEENLHQPISKIIIHAEKILHCIATDPLDVEAGEKFLDRYLPAVLKLIHNHIKFSANKHIDPKFEAILQQHIDVLNKLEQAFLNQYQSLLQNDVDDVVSELKIIDKLLKIEGHHK